MITVENPVTHPPIEVIRKDLWQRLVQFRDGDTEVDLSSRGFTSWFLEKGADPVTDKIVIDIDDGDSNIGDLVLSLTVAQTTAMVAGRQYSWWFAELIDGDPVTLWRGRVIVGDQAA